MQSQFVRMQQLQSAAKSESGVESGANLGIVPKKEELSTFRPILEQEPNLSTDSNAVLYGNVEESTLPKIL